MVDIRQYLFSKCIYLVSMRLPSDPRKRLPVDVLSQPTETLVLCAWKWLKYCYDSNSLDSQTSDYLAQLSHSHRLLVCCLIFLEDNNAITLFSGQLWLAIMIITLQLSLHFSHFKTKLGTNNYNVFANL